MNDGLDGPNEDANAEAHRVIVNDLPTCLAYQEPGALLFCERFYAGGKACQTEDEASALGCPNFHTEEHES